MEVIHNLKHLSRILIYRNAVFHPGIELNYNQRGDKKKLVFEDDYGKFEVDIEGFIADFHKLMIFITTCNYLVANLLFKGEHEGQNIFQVNYEYAKKHGIIKFMDWQMKERITNRLVKYFL